MDFLFFNGVKQGIAHMYNQDGGIVFTHYYVNGEKLSKEDFDTFMNNEN